jgi:hypothetical protein
MQESEWTPPPDMARRLAREEVSRRNLRRLVEHWDAVRGGRQMPARRDVHPEDLAFMLGQVMLIDVHEVERPKAALAFRFRLVGTLIEEAGHPGLQGRWVHELSPDVYRRLVHFGYALAVNERAPNFYRVALDHAGQKLRYERVVLPLSQDGGRIDTLLVGTEWDAENEAFFRAYPAVGAEALATAANDDLPDGG